MDTRPKILSIDNNSANQRLLAAILGLDYQLTTAMSGAQGLRMLDEVGADVILLDIDMPGMDGLQTCRNIRNHPKYVYTPIIFLSCLSSRDDQLRAFNSGGDDFIAKPYDIEILRARINAHVQRSRRSGHSLIKEEPLDELALIHLRQSNHYLMALMKTQSLTHLCELTLDTLNKIGLKAALRIHKRPDLTCSSCGPLTDLEASLLSDAQSIEPSRMSARFVLGSVHGALMIQNMPNSGSVLYGQLQEILLMLFEAFSFKAQSLVMRFSAEQTAPGSRSVQQDITQLSAHVEKALRVVEKQCDEEIAEILAQLNQLLNLPAQSLFERAQLAVVDTRLRQVKSSLLTQCMELEGRCLQFLAGHSLPSMG